MLTILRAVEGPIEGHEIEVGHELTLGRDSGVGLDADVGVSRQHARLRDEGGELVVEDLDSSNGTFINGEPVTEPRVLREGDLLQIGSSAFEVELDPGAAETEAIAFDPATAPAPIPPAPTRRRPPPAAEPEPAGGGGVQLDAGNWPALTAIVLGPLSLLLLLAGGGVLFYAALPVGIAAIALGSVGKRRADAGAGMRGVAVAGQVFGVIGTILAAIAILVLIAVGVATDLAADNLNDLIDDVEQEIRSQTG